MLSAVLKSPRAVEVSLAVARAFVRMRHFLVTQEELVRRVEALAENLNSFTLAGDHLPVCC